MNHLKQFFHCLNLKISAIVFLIAIFTNSPTVFATANVEDQTASCQQIHIYWREGCPHCAKAHVFLKQLHIEQPELQIIETDIRASESNLEAFLRLNKQLGIERPGVPLILVCQQALVGFDHASTTGQEIRELLKTSTPSSDNRDLIRLPLFGEISISEIGLPVFTIIIGLIDGFNPCAMWVLLFLLSLVVNVKDRKRIFAIAGTFVLVSGLVYFAFMAAWLNLFKVIGWSRGLQITLAFFALFMGLIHIKDFVAFKKGFSFSIPDKYKPAIYKQSRKVIKQHHIGLSIVSVAILAIMVNFIELLCTAGLPALFTQILVQQDLSDAGYYGYLALYNLAYIFDDSVMVAIAIIGLRHNKLQEQQGKWLKLLSGVTIILLGILLLLKPEWLF